MRLKAVLLCGFALITISATVWAQNVTGQISGTVKDPTGAVVPNATITVTNTDQGAVVRTVTTSAGGDFSAPLLPVGRYSLTVEAPGFQKFTQTGIVVNVNDRLTFFPTLTVGAGGQQVTVQAEVNQVDLQSPQASGLITGLWPTRRRAH